MLFNGGNTEYDNEYDLTRKNRVARLENFHRKNHSWLLVVLLTGFFGFGAWAMTFRIDEVTRATGEVIASSRVQVIQAVDGGVLSQLMVAEGDRVVAGQVLACLDHTRVGAKVGEVDARLFGLTTKALRLRAEVTGAETVNFPTEERMALRERQDIERALFKQRRIGFNEEMRTLRVAVYLAQKELELNQQLLSSGDISGMEVIQGERAVNNADARLVNAQNSFMEEARIDLSKVEDEIAQNSQVLMRYQQELSDSIFTSNVNGIVKNIRVTTVGGVLRAGEEIMQIVPVDDDLIIEAKIKPTDIAYIRPGLVANIRFDPFDYTIFGGVTGKVLYVSADTLKEETGQGEEIYYRVHVSSSSNPVTTTTGKVLEILPGMTAQVDIRTGDRTLMDYLLKPLRKTLMESFGER